MFKKVYDKADRVMYDVVSLFFRTMKVKAKYLPFTVLLHEFSHAVTLGASLRRGVAAVGAYYCIFERDVVCFIEACCLFLSL